MRILRFFILIGIISLVACTTSETVYAPVYDVSMIEHIPKNGIYRVQSGETLYSIAWRYGLDYRYVANRNNISPPYHIAAGQLLYLHGKAAKASFTPTNTSKYQPVYSSSSEYEPTSPVTFWMKPARGSLGETFSARNKGINIRGQLGDPIYATAPGKVVYSGDGLRGYGNLIIIKHNSSFLTAYAHNDEILVKPGDWVKRGQVIAKMGNSGTRRVMLHFEIRRNGKPVNPLRYLS